MIVRCAEDPNGLAGMLADLLTTNLARHPKRAAHLRHSCIGIRASDIGLSATLDVEPGRLTVSNGLARERLDVKIRSDASTLLELARVPAVLGIVPDPLDSKGRGILRKLRSKELRVTGLLRHPLMVARLMKLLSEG